MSGHEWFPKPYRRAFVSNCPFHLGLVWHTVCTEHGQCQYFQPQLETNVPDLVIFGIGINDSYVPADHFHQDEFEQNYRDLMAMFTAVNPDVQFLFMTNNDSYYNNDNYGGGNYGNKNKNDSYFSERS